MITWSLHEEDILIAAISEGKKVKDILIDLPDKTISAIKHKRIRLQEAGIVKLPDRSWSEAQITSLIVQANQGVKLTDMVVVGKTPLSIADKFRRLTYEKIIGHIPEKKYWTRKELWKLRDYAIAQSLSARTIFESNFLPGRSQWAITKQMGRKEFTHPRLSRYAQEAMRLKPEQRSAAFNFLQIEGRYMPTKEIAARLQEMLNTPIKLTTVRTWRLHNGTNLSWYDARAHYLTGPPQTATMSV